MSILEISLKMKGKGTEKCTGLMAQSTKENGDEVFSMAKDK